jgi:chemotaxis signal transduction protein
MTDIFQPTSMETLAGAGGLPAAPSRSVETTDRQGFRIGELAELSTIYRVPGAAKAIQGVVNLHGNVVPVFDLHAHFGESRSADERTMLLVLGRGASAAAVMIDGLPKRKKFLPEEAIAPSVLASALQDYAAGAWAQSDGFWCDFAHEALLEWLARG